MPSYIRISLLCLIFFAVFSFAAVEPWSALVLQTAVFFLFAVYLFGNGTVELSSLNKALLLFFSITIILGLISCLSERTVLDGQVKYPFTLSVLYTLTELIYYLFLLTSALLASFVFNEYKKIKILLLAFAVCGVAVVIAANVFSGGEYIALFRHLRSSAGSIGPFINRNNAGVFLGFCFFCALAYFAARHFEYAGAGRKNFLYEQLCIGAVCALLVYGVISTRSRGAMLFLALTLVLSAALFIVLFIKNKNKKIISFIVLFLGSALIFAAVFFNLSAINKFSGRAGGMSEKIRMQIYSNAANMLKEYPIFGVGAGAFSAGLSAYGKNMQNVKHIHNDWLEFVLGTGFAGGVCLLLFIFAALLIFLKRLAAIESPHKKVMMLGLGSALFYMAAASFVDFHLHIPANAFAFFIVFGALSSETFGFSVRQIRVNTIVKILVCLLFAASLFFTFRQSAAWRGFFLGASLSLDKKIEYYEQALPYYGSASNALRLAVAYYDAFLIEEDASKKEKYAEKSDLLFSKYLQRYPVDENLLSLKYQMRAKKARL